MKKHVLICLSYTKLVLITYILQLVQTVKAMISLSSMKSIIVVCLLHIKMMNKALSYV